MTTQAHDPALPATTTQTPRRADAKSVRLSRRDIDGLLLSGEHYGALLDLLDLLDLLAATLCVSDERLPVITARWRRAAYTQTGRLSSGPGWCWLTRDGMTATGLRFPAIRPALGRLAHIRAVLAARIWMQDNDTWAEGQPLVELRTPPARRPSRGRPGRARGGRGDPLAVPGPLLLRRAGLAIEAELTPKATARTARIMAGLLSLMRYAQVLYLTAPAARPVVLRAAATLSSGGRVVVRDLPSYAFAEAQR